MTYGKTLEEIKAMRVAKESGLHKNPNPMITADAGVATQPVEKPLKKKVRKSSKKK